MTVLFTKFINEAVSFESCSARKALHGLEPGVLKKDARWTFTKELGTHL